MKVSELEKLLSNQEVCGFRAPAHSEDYLAWLLVRKQYIAPVTPWDPQEEPEKYAMWLRSVEAKKKLPYQVTFMELKREVHLKRGYPENEDFWERRTRYFANFEEMEEYLKQQGFSIEDIKSCREIDCP